MTPGIAVISDSAHITARQLDAMVRACAVQMVEFCDAWGRRAIAVVPYARSSDIPHGTPTIVLTDDAHEPGALAWHTEQSNGLVSGVVDATACVAAGGDILSGELSVSCALSHELLEAAVDPQVNLWVERPDRRLVAREVCDPVQDQTYEIAVEGEAVTVSSYVLAAWFDDSPPAGSTYDRGGVLVAPFSRTAGGYMIVRAGGRTHQEGMRAPHRATHMRARGMRRSIARGGAS